MTDMKCNLIIILLMICPLVIIKAQWSGTNPIWTNSNVGIGTSSPYGKLHVFSQGTPGAYYDGELQVGGFVGTTDDVTMSIGTNYTNKTMFIQGWRGGYGAWIPLLLNPLGGNVGIGTNTPLGKLDIYNPSSNSVLLSFPRATNSAVKAAWVSLDGNDNTILTTTNGVLDFKTNWNNGNPLSTLSLLNNGNVGIGTNAPTNKLCIGTIPATAGLLSVLTNSTSIGHTEELGLLISNNGGSGKRAQIGFGYSESKCSAVIGGVISNTGGATTNDIFFATRTSTDGAVDPTERMRITDTGNVGIGTIAPSDRFSVYNKFVVNHDGVLKWGGSADYGLLSWDDGRAIVGGQTNEGLALYANNSEKVRILINGNVLVGKITQSNSTYKLDVEGKIRANEVVVNTDGADYVFAPDYKLLKLHEVESFIKENNHLPEIPSSKDMKENGVNVSEMQTKLLQKIEELTLYIIEQNKKLDQQNIKIQTLETKIEKIESASSYY